MKLITTTTAIFFYLLSFAQPTNDNCSDATYLCPGNPVTSTNIDATTQTCSGCEDDLLVLSNCLIPDNTVWFKFITNEVGGIVSINLDNIVYNTDTSARATDLEIIVYEMGSPCIPSTYTSMITNCADTNNNTEGNSSFSINTLPLNPHTVYYVLVDGIGFGSGIFFPGEATFDISVSGSGVVRPIPNISLTTSSLNICKGDLVTMTAIRSSDCILDSNFTWTQNGNILAITSVDTFQTNTINDGDYIGVSTVCDSVCGGSIPVDSIQFNVLELVLDAGNDITIIEGESTPLNGMTNSLNFLVDWVPGNTLSNSSVINPVASPIQTTTYFMTITDTLNGCSDSDSVTISVDRKLKIPDTFTPNGDGVNDTWEIVTADQYPNCEIIIYNRWGAVVFRANGYNDSKFWNGKSKGGKDLSPGAYFYYIDFKDPLHPDPYRGVVNIVR